MCWRRATYHEHRAALMIAAKGMTKTYNRFHDFDERVEPIRRLRELHYEMDRAVLDWRCYYTAYPFSPMKARLSRCLAL